MNHDSRFFTFLSFILLFILAACQTSALPSPTATSLPPTETPLPTETAAPTPTVATTVDSCEPGQNIFSPLNPKEYIGEVDGSRLVKEVEKLSGSEVDVSGKVIESEYFYLPGEVDSTIVLINVMGGDGNTYQAMIELPDKGLSVEQYLPDTDIHAVGIVLGELPAPSPDFFKLNPNDEGKQYPLILAELASGGCKER